MAERAAGGGQALGTEDQQDDPQDDEEFQRAD
jgi:hypothetical protein